MSKRNNRAKRLEKRFEEMEEDILKLNEENSGLRQLIDVQGDCFKAREQRLQWEIAALKAQHKDMTFCIKSHNEVNNATIKLIREVAGDIRDCKDELRDVTDEVMHIDNGLQDSAGTFLGKTILKYFRKERSL